jgi:hypothetical protein
MHQQLFIGLELSALENVVPNGEEGLRQAAGVDKRQSGRYRQTRCLRCNAILGVAATINESHDGIAQLKPCSGGTGCSNRASDLEARDFGVAFGRRIEPLTLLDVWPVDPGRRHFDQDLAVAGERSCHGAREKDLRATLGSNFDGGHFVG